jgi:hypothetical protein
LIGRQWLCLPTVGERKEIDYKTPPKAACTYSRTRLRWGEKNKFPLNEAVEAAIKYCIDNNVLRDFLKTHGSEVYNMLITEYNREEEM